MLEKRGVMVAREHEPFVYGGEADHVKDKEPSRWRLFFTVLITAVVSIAATLGIQDFYVPAYKLPALSESPCMSFYYQGRSPMNAVHSRNDHAKFPLRRNICSEVQPHNEGGLVIAYTK